MSQLSFAGMTEEVSAGRHWTVLPCTSPKTNSFGQVIQGGGNMPAYGKNLSPAETTALVAFLKRLHRRVKRRQVTLLERRPSGQARSLHALRPTHVRSPCTPSALVDSTRRHIRSGYHGIALLSRLASPSSGLPDRNFW